MKFEEPTEYEFLPEAEVEIFHLLNCPAYQVGHIEKQIGQEFNH